MAKTITTKAVFSSDVSKPVKTITTKAIFTPVSANVIEKVGNDAINQINKKWESAINLNKPAQNVNTKGYGVPKTQIPETNYMSQAEQNALKTIRTNNLKLDTLGEDITKAADTYKTVVSGWQDADTMKKSKTIIENAYNRLNALNVYNADYGNEGADVSKQLNAYKSILDNWGALEKQYGEYDSADKYNKAVKNAAAQEKADNLPIIAYDGRIASLEHDLKVAEELYKNWYNISSKVNYATGEEKKAREEAAKKASDEYKSYLRMFGYGTIDEMKAALDTLKKYKSSAKRYQNLQELSSVITVGAENYDKEAQKYIEKGNATDYNSVGRYQQGGYTDANGVRYVGGSIDDKRAAAIALAEHNGVTVVKKEDEPYDDSKVDLYRYFKDDEFDILAYYIAKDKETGGNKTQEYLNAMEETLINRQSKTFFDENLKDNTFLEILYAVPVGLDQFASGVKNLFNTEDDYIPLSSTQIAGQLARDDLGDDGFKLPEWLGGASIAQVAYDGLSTTANMAPSILASFVSNAILPGSGAVVGGTLLGGSAAGNAYQEALNNGMDKSQARTYSTLVGTSEALLSTTLSKVMGGKAISGKLKTAIDGIEKGFVRFAANFGVAFVSEGLEEGIQEILEPFFENFALGYQKNGFEDIDWGEVAYSFLLGGISGGTFEIAGAGINRIAKGVKVNKTYNTGSRVLNLIELGLKMPKESKSYKLAQKYNAQTKADGKLSKNKVYNLVLATENLVADRLIQLGEKNNVAEVASASVKKLTGIGLSIGEIELLSKSSYGQEVLNTIVPKVEDTNAPVTENLLQGDADSGIINNNQETGVDIDGSTNPELLAGREVPTVSRSGNGVRQQSENSRKLVGYLGNMGTEQGTDTSRYRAGESGWLVRGSDVQEGQTGLKASLLRAVSGIEPSGKDTAGRTISSKIAEAFEKTVFKDKDGNLLSLYHWTIETFEKFAKGEFGFHFGVLDAAHDRYTQKKKENPDTPIGIYKEVYANITNPIELKDNDVWDACWVALQLKEKGIITDEQYNQLSEMEGFFDNTYDNPAANAVRKILDQNGYDGIIYKNDSEDAGSYSVIALYPEQILTVAENGVLKENSGVTEADPEGPADFMPEGENSSLNEGSDESGKLGRGVGEIADFGGLDTNKGKHLDKAQQDEIKEIGNKLNREVVFEDFYSSDKFKGKKKIPDGYIAKDGTVYINYYAKRPVQFLLKHEITHYLKRSAFSYQDFMNLVFDSSAFKDWLNRRGYSSIDGIKAEIMQTYSEVENFDEGRCYDEILADFVGEYLFGGENTISQKLINALQPKQKKTFRDVIKSIIDYFKSKFQKNKPIQTEIENIENRFMKVYKEAVEVKTDDGSGDIEEEYAIYNHRGNLVEVNWDSDNFSSLSQQLKNHLEEVNNMQPVDNISFKSTNGKELYTTVVNAFKKFGFKIDVQNFGTIELSEKEVDLAVKSYINTDAEAAALLSIPRVLKRGKIISGHQNHKNRGYSTITFAAPVELNGKVGNVVVAVKVTSKTRYNAHRVLMPDGTEFILDAEKDTESQSARPTNKNEGRMLAKDSVPDNRLAQNEPIVKNNISKEDEDYSIPSVMSAEGLLERYENGEITRAEYLNLISRKKTLNPAEIANLSETDADTTATKRSRKQGESEGDGDSKFYGSLMESDIFDQRFKDEAKDDTFIQKYKTVTNKETLRKAAKELDEGGRYAVERWWALTPERANLIDTAMGFILMDRYQRVGDYESAIAAAEKVREFGTASGQQVQIFSILGRLNPNTMAVYAQNELTKAYEIMIRGKTKKWIQRNESKFLLTDEDVEFIRLRTIQAAQLPEGRDKAIRLAEIATRIEDKLPPERGRGIKAWQRISMLLNAKTQIRNITGNGIMVPVFIASDFFGSGIDKMVSHYTDVRTTGNFKLSSVKGIKKGIFETMDDFRRHINTRNTDMDRFEIGAGKSFNEQHKGKLANQLNNCAKVLNALDRFTSFCLELGDRPFYEMWFINSLNNQMKLNNVDEATPEMVAIASHEALQRTWQDTNKMTKFVSGFRSELNAIAHIGEYGLGDVFIKFTKTPANLTKAIFDFSPAGVVKAIAVDAKNLKNAIQTGRFEAKLQKQFVDSLSKGIAGTLLYVLVCAAVSAGYITGAGDEDKDVANFEKYIQGMPEYSVKIFGKWYSYDWAQPIGAVMATVADYMKAKEKNPDNEWYENILEAIKSGGEVLYNQSFMQSIQMLFTADTIIDGVIEGALGEPSVFVPQLLSQFANATDDYRRVTYENDKSFQSAINRVKAKIPGLRQTLPKQIDVLGREVPNSQKSVFNAFLNPGNTYTDTSTPVTDEIYELYTKTKDKTLMPKVAPYSITVKGTTKSFTADEKNDFQRIIGTTTSDILEIAIKAEGYKKLLDEQKIDFINNVYDFATKKAKSSFEYDYKTLSSMVGEYSNGQPILTEDNYNKLPEEAREMLAQEYFFTKAEMRFVEDYESLVEYYINKTK